MKHKPLIFHADRKGSADTCAIETEDIRSRGFFEDLDAFPGTISFCLRDRKGTRIFHCTVPSGISTDARESLCIFLESFLDELDPPSHLRSVP